MIATLWSIDSWVISNDHKPSLQAWNYLKKNSPNVQILEVKTLEPPTLTTLNVRGGLLSGDFSLIAKFNLLEYKNCYYRITDMKVVQDGIKDENGKEIFTIDIKGEIDVYLTFMVKKFNENDTLDMTLIYFAQKNMNRWMYAETSANTPVKYVNFSQQYYLRNVPDALSGIGKNLEKVVYVVNEEDYYYSSPNDSSDSTDYYFTSYLSDYACTGAAYLAIKPQYRIAGNDFLAKMSICTPTICYTNITPGKPKQVNDPWNGVPWFMINSLTAISSEYYVGAVILPITLDRGWLIKEKQIVPINYYSWTDAAVNFGSAVLNWKGVDGNNFYSNYQNGMMYSVTENCPTFINYASLFGGVTTPSSLYKQWINNVNKFTADPSTLMFCKMRARASGEDSFIDVTAFDQIICDWGSKFAQLSLNNYGYLLSFQMSLEFPHIQITNAQPNQMIVFTTLLSQFFDVSVVNYYVPLWWGYNTVNDAVYCLNIKSQYETNSTAWANYLANHLNQYNMAMNISHMKIQNDQANIGIDAAKAVASAGNWFDDIFDPGKVATEALNAAQGITNSSFALMEQNQNYKYLAKGMKGDMSRVSNERLATGISAYTMNNYALGWIFEGPVDYERIAINNYFALNGYEVNKWIPWHFWNNRTYFNFVKCSFFSNAFYSQINLVYKNMIDQLLNQGIRIVDEAYVLLPSYSHTINFMLITNNLNSIIQNNELYTTNSEINFISPKTFAPEQNITSPFAPSFNPWNNPWAEQKEQQIKNIIDKEIDKELDKLEKDVDKLLLDILGPKYDKDFQDFVHWLEHTYIFNKLKAYFESFAHSEFEKEITDVQKTLDKDVIDKIGDKVAGGVSKAIDKMFGDTTGNPFAKWIAKIVIDVFGKSWERSLLKYLQGTVIDDITDGLLDLVLDALKGIF